MELLTESDVSREFNIARQTLMNWRSRGKGPSYIRFGRAVRYCRKDLLEFLDRNRVTPGG